MQKQQTKETNMILPVILSGGSGTRLWPLSRELYPKQLLPLVGDQTMVQATVTRLNGLPNLASSVVVCNDSHRFMIAEQLQEIGENPSAIILEPVGRNTAPAVALAALNATEKKGKDPVLLVLPADHVIQDIPAFHEAVRTGLKLAEKGSLITFGIVPKSPETGYGYIKKGNPINRAQKKKSGSKSKPLSTDTSHLMAYTVSRFTEKPDLKKARSFLKSGDYLWNSGMFMFKASAYLKELGKFSTEILKSCRKAYRGAYRDLDFIRLDESAFRVCPSNSVDYSVMEKTKSAVVVPLDAGWSDIGSWSSLWAVCNRDVDGNAVSGDVISLNTRNSMIHAESRLVASIGLEDLVIVETADAILVARKDQTQKTKKLVQHLKSGNRDEALFHRRVNRPWGAYECIDCSERFQVKRITVKPKGKLSLQKHLHRAEHWIVVKGTARITKGTEVITLSENESTYIPLGVKHRLENPGRIPLELIEVQSGSYLGEDDIERFDDQYGRKGGSTK
jgi:mannose-1-phosphate guanylyltransferase/mannose-6-phosphate isomerase